MANPQTDHAAPDAATKPPSMIGAMLKGAAGLGLTGAIIGALGGAALLAATFAIGGATAGTGWVAAVAEFAPINLGLGAGVASAGSAALAGLGIGAASGALLGAPAGAVAAPLAIKQKQTEAAIPVIAEQAMKQGYAMRETHSQELDQESTKFRDMVDQQRGQAKAQGSSLSA